MISRNFCIQKYFEQLAGAHVPAYRFNGSTAAQWRPWRDQLLPKVIATLGRNPPRVPLNPQTIAEWNEDGIVKRKFIIDVEEGLSLTGYLFRPAGASGRLPAILCCHGHGQFGKEAVMGNRSSTELCASIAMHNYDYGLQMARAGFVTMAIDWWGFGDRDDRRRPHTIDKFAGRDPCNVHFIRATILGMTVLGLNVQDARRSLDYLCDQDFVDPARLGVMGLSFGGTMTVWTAICDGRIKAADVICYSDRFSDFAIRDCNFCGSQITPGLFELCDVPDLQGLIAPRPLLVEIGTHDDCFPIESALSCYHEVRKIYAAADAGDRLELDLFEGGHRWGANRSVDFFNRWL